MWSVYYVIIETMYEIIGAIRPFIGNASPNNKLLRGDSENS